MAKFLYTVQDAQGVATNGAIDAADEDQAVLQLQNKGLFILSIQAETVAKSPFSGGKKGSGKVGGQDLAFFAEQLSTLLSGGVPLIRALSLLGEHGENTALAAIVSDISKEVGAGGSLCKALEKHPKCFDAVWVSLVQAGEMGGQLPGALRQIANYTQSQEAVKSKIITAIAYPAVLMVMSLGVLGYFIVYIVPVFADIFKDFHLQLPVLTQIIVDISNLVTHHLMLLIGFIVLVVLGVKSYLSTEVGRFTWDQTKYKLPLVGKFIRNIQLERLLTTMATLIRSGVSILNTITVLEGAFTKSPVIQRALRSVKNDVAAGRSISAAFKNTGIFPGLITEMMWMGEESGKLPDIIGVLSKFYIEQIN
ncbi:MAG TPA: type II secretion system F family protein, partial [Elusimicrobiales bacterium]|nr:type II secretion system F family protein [Elusimicrobiales bacterium]